MSGPNEGGRRRVAIDARAVGMIASIAVAAAGCSRETPADKKAAGQANVAPAAAAGGGPQRGGHIRIPSNEPTYLNPILETRFDVTQGLVFEGLVGVDAKLEPVKRLAESWQVSEDGKVITFKLRPNLTWSDGQKLTSRDVRFTVDVIHATGAPSLWRAYLAPITRLDTPDDTTVVATYAEPYAPALMTWTMPILPAHVYGDGSLAQSKGNEEPVGSGPYKVVRWEKGKRILLEANDRWWMGRPNVDTIELVLGIADGDMLGQLQQGQLDFAPITIIDQWVNTTQTAEFLADFEVSDVVESRIRLIAWNGDRKPFDQKKVRQALTLAIDRGRIIDDVLLGQARPLSAPFFPTMFGGDDSIAAMPFDVERARKLLDEAAPAKGGKRFAIEMIAADSQRGPVTDATLAIVRRDLEGLGIDLRLTMLPAREYSNRMAKRAYDAAYFGWLPDIPDPDPYALLHSSQLGLGGNYAQYTNPEVDKLLDEARRAPSRGARKEIYAKVHALVADDQPYTPLYAPYGHYAWSRRLRAVNPRDIGPPALSPGVARWWVTPRPTKGV
jgi:peptide/nickel transport system substrate-binding protein